MSHKFERILSALLYREKVLKEFDMCQVIGGVL